MNSNFDAQNVIFANEIYYPWNDTLTDKTLDSGVPKILLRMKELTKLLRGQG